MKILPFSLVQCFILCCGQVCLKIALERMPHPSLSWSFIQSLLHNFWFLGCGLCFGCASLIWFYIIHNFPFSEAYPLNTLSKVFGLMAAVMVFHEAVPMTRWIGVGLIIIGCLLVAK